MLNTNKIDSDINFKNLTKIDITGILNIPYSTTVNRMKSGKWTPDDIEKFADYFGRTIAYYFDREEKEEVKALSIPGTTQVFKKPYAELGYQIRESDPGETYGTYPECPVCATKDKLIVSYEKQIALLELSLGKNLKSDCV